MADKKDETGVKKPERKPMRPETMTVLVIGAVFLISLLMAEGALRYILTIMCVICLGDTDITR